MGSAGPQAAAQEASGNGLTALYHDNKDLTGLELTRIDGQVNFSWGRGSPAPGIEPDTFSVRWQGGIKPATSGVYTFYTRTSDGARLWVDGKLIIDKWVNQKRAREWKGTARLQAGKRHDIRLEYYENTGTATAQLSWSGPGVAKQVIPKSRLYPSATGPALTVDAAADRRPISPDIYGMNFADEALASELQLPVRRWGGNATTRYNWENDTANHASDWFFENIPKDNPNPDALPGSSSFNRFVEQDRRTGTKTLLTVPIIGWTPKSRAYACGFSVAKYGQQQKTDPCGSVRIY